MKKLLISIMLLAFTFPVFGAAAFAEALFYGSTQIGYMTTFGDQNQTQFMTIPISVGYKQDLLFYNPLKWARQIEPLKLARAEKELA